MSANTQKPKPEGVDRTIPGEDGETNMGQDSPEPKNKPDATDEAAKRDGRPANPTQGETEGT